MIDTFTEILTQKTKKMGLRTASMMADLLNISEDSAYRRIKNPRSLRADELIILAKEFDIDLNKLAQTNPNWLSGEYKPLNFDSYTSSDFYKELEAKLDRCIHLPHSQITYGAKEIPFFYYMWFPALAAFKTFIWNREFIKNPKFNICFGHVFELSPGLPNANEQSQEKQPSEVAGTVVHDGGHPPVVAQCKTSTVAPRPCQCHVPARAVPSQKSQHEPQTDEGIGWPVRGGSGRRKQSAQTKHH